LVVGLERTTASRRQQQAAKGHSQRVCVIILFEMANIAAVRSQELNRTVGVGWKTKDQKLNPKIPRLMRPSKVCRPNRVWSLVLGNRMD
jgi:hypothetical protein